MKALTNIAFIYCVVMAAWELVVAIKNWSGDRERWIDASVATLFAIFAVVLWRFV